ncbi:MAG: hypothetical protein GC200_08010 [Tepidisphaera sp.]|nr:hypothetical protein [Tepidisphaera sp.]
MVRALSVRRCARVFALLAGLAAAPALLAQTGSFMTIPAEQGFDYAVVQDISADGQFALVSLQNSTQRPFPLISYILNLQTGGKTYLNGPNGEDLNALAINYNGTTVVGTLGGGPLQGSAAFVWHNGEINVIGGLGTGEINYATGVSDTDPAVVVGVTTTAFGDGYSQGWKWTEPDGFTALDDIGNDVLTFSSVQGVSASGTVIVGSGTIGDFDPDTDDFMYGAVWDNSIVPTNIGNLPNPFNVGSEGWAASANGDAVVGFGGGTSSTGAYANRAFRYIRGGGIENLGELPGHPEASIYALDCDTAAFTVVGYSVSGGPSTWNAVTWNEIDGWRTLRDQLAARGVTYPADLALRETFCSDGGDVLGGWAYNTTTQKYVGYVATLPYIPPCSADFNQDGVADQGDLDYLIDIIAGAPNIHDANPDFNRDGVADQGDVDAAINVVAGGDCVY